MLFFKLESFSDQNIKWKKELPLCIYIYRITTDHQYSFRDQWNPMKQKRNKAVKKIKKVQKEGKKKESERVMSQH